MFDFLRRRHVASAPPPKRAPTVKRPVFDLLAPVPGPEVTEGNADSDWSAWEHSVAFQDSQMPSPYPETKPVPLQPADAGDSIISTAYDTIRGSDL